MTKNETTTPSSKFGLAIVLICFGLLAYGMHVLFEQEANRSAAYRAELVADAKACAKSPTCLAEAERLATQRAHDAEENAEHLLQMKMEAQARAYLSEQKP